MTKRTKYSAEVRIMDCEWCGGAGGYETNPPWPYLPRFHACEACNGSGLYEIWTYPIEQEDLPCPSH